MKIGDLVRWENADGIFELGIVTDTYGDESINVVVYFPEDGYPSTITRGDLEVINESR
jgi:hypothetical protein